jgi:hypothetical protein
VNLDIGDDTTRHYDDDDDDDDDDDGDNISTIRGVPRTKKCRRNRSSNSKIRTS